LISLPEGPETAPAEYLPVIMRITTIFGSNSGNKKQLIDEATILLSRKAGPVADASSYYETAPWGFDCDSYFLNRVIVFDTDLSPEIFLQQALETERELGRERHAGGPRYTSRPIDIDLLFCESLILNTPALTLPHPRIAERNFVLVPLAEIMPDFLHPVFRKSIGTLLAACPDRLSVLRIDETTTNTTAPASGKAGK